MTSMTALGASAPRQPGSAFGMAAEPANRSSCRYRLVRNDSTGPAEGWTDGTFRDRIGNTFIEFVDAAALTVERKAGFVSINESSPGFSILRRVEEQLDRLCLAAFDEQFEAGIESRFSGELQRRTLASSSTLCRFERRAERQWAIAIHQELLEQFIASFARRPEEVVLDFEARVQVLNAYEQDGTCGTWERLADAVHPDGSMRLKQAGGPEAGKAKCEWAGRIAPHMDPDRNRSKSFQVFRDGIRNLAEA